MLLSEHKDLKLAIRSLPEKEKDKLLLRLVARDKVLTEHLHFKLLEDVYDLKARCESLSAVIEATMGTLSSRKRNTAKETLTIMRGLMGKVNHHFKVTKDPESDVELRILLLDRTPVGFRDSIFSAAHKFNERLSLYFVKSTLSVVNKYHKMHEDLQFDLKEAMNNILKKVYANETGTAARTLGLPKEL